LTELAALLAWLGGALVVLSDSRRGLALGLVLTGIGLAVLVWATGGPAGAVTLALGGVLAAGLRLRGGPMGWGLMEPGSTPRLILTVVVGILALWVAVTVAAGDQASLRFAILAVIGLAGARLLQAREQTASLTAAACLALAIGAAAGITDETTGPAPYVLAAAIAIITSVFVPARRVGT
jgi:hypothetical protein